MARKESLFMQYAQDAAAHVAKKLPHMDEAQRKKLLQEVLAVLLERAAVVIGGERVYAPKEAETIRLAQRERIEKALVSQVPSADIARREKVSERWVRSLRKRGTIG